MPLFKFAVAVCLLHGFAPSALGQRIIIIPQFSFGTAETVAFVTELPPQVRADVKQQLHHETQVGYVYKHFHLLGGSFWT